MKFNIPYIHEADSLIDIAFKSGAREAKKARSTREEKDKRTRKAARKNITITGNIICGNLKSIVKAFPSYEQLPDFYREFFDLEIDMNDYKKAAGSVKWCADNVEKLQRNSLKNIRRDSDIGEINRVVSNFLGRSASMVKQITPFIDRLIMLRQKLIRFSDVEFDKKTVVIAGYPNVGKSTFLRTLTGSKVKIADYPFTTQRVLLGHRDVRFKYEQGLRYEEVQILDTPGILDRPLDERNYAESRALSAIRHLSDVIIYLIDPQQDIKKQLALLEEIESKISRENHENSPVNLEMEDIPEIPAVPLIIAINKSDITEKEKIERIKDEIKNKGGYRVIPISSKDIKDCEKVFDEALKNADFKLIEESP